MLKQVLLFYSSTTSSMGITKLYGGAIESSLPSDIKDVSKFRQVPDNQEVFILEDGPKDISIIFDLLQHNNLGLEASLKENLDDIFENYSTGTPEPIDITVCNSQAISVTVTAESVVSFVAVIYLTEADTDVLITVNAPGTSIEEAKQKYYPIFAEACTTFNVVDKSIFGGIQ